MHLSPSSIHLDAMYDHMLTKKLYSQRTGVKPEKVQNSPRVPVDLTYNMGRFGQENGKKIW